MNTTVEGVLENEDVDYYVTAVKKGQRISAEVEGIRLAGAFYDPYLAILNSERFELAASDDTALLLQDSSVSVIAPADGNYIIQIRESSYTGNGNCRYRLHIGAFPRPAAVYPAGGQSGTDLEVRLIGDPGGESTRTITLPTEADENYLIRAEVSRWIADPAVQVVLITGGTGFSGRDSTPEAVSVLFDKTVDGFGELFRALSLEEIGTSTLQSRCVAGLANGTLLVARGVSMAPSSSGSQSAPPAGGGAHKKK